jgi:pimeloyl-ACP methyl ester carboxylesterase
MNQFLLAFTAVALIPVAIYGLVTLVSWFIYLPHAVAIFKTPLRLSVPTIHPLAGGCDVWFRTADGLKLRGTYLSTRSRQRRGLIVYAHGYNGSRWNATPYVVNLLERGFDVFVFDFRGHGDSAAHPRYRPLHWVTQHEVIDLKAAIDCAVGMGGTPAASVGVIGISRGGAAALCLAAHDNRIAAIVADGVFSTDAIQCHFMRRYMSIYSRLAFVWASLPNIGLFSYRIGPRLLAGITQHCRYLNVERKLRRVRQPVFLIHGQRDSFVPLEVVQKVRSLIAGRTKFWLVPRAKHNAAISLARAEYEHRIERFFRRHLSLDARQAVAEPAGDGRRTGGGATPRRRQTTVGIGFG